MHSAEEIRQAALQAMRLTDADEAEVLIISGRSALTRFAGNRIHQNIVEADARLSIRAVLGLRSGVAGTNRLDDASIERCAAAAVEAARHAPSDPAFPGLPGPKPLEIPERTAPAQAIWDAGVRAQTARCIIEESRTRGLEAAGSVAVSDHLVAVVNTHGVDACAEADDVRITVLSTGQEEASGWASFYGRGDGVLDEAPLLGMRAAKIAQRSARPTTLEPGLYTVVLAAEAVADLLDFLGYLGFGAKAFLEGSSFLAEAIDTQVADKRICMQDDALAPETVGIPFDFEGQPRKRTALIRDGIAQGPVTDSYFAARLERPNTGHALPAPNPYGPLPANIEMHAGEASVEEMITSVDRGVYVTRFHYVNVDDPMKTVLTGMTRDGTFLIENGRLTKPLRNLRFTQSVLAALSQVAAVGAERRLFGGEGAAVLAPALLIDRWAFTGQTAGAVDQR